MIFSSSGPLATRPPLVFGPDALPPLALAALLEVPLDMEFELELPELPPDPPTFGAFLPNFFKQ